MLFAPHAHQNIQKETFFETPHALIIIIFIYLLFFFLLLFSLILSPRPDNPPHPWLISRRGTGAAVCSGLSFKNSCSSSEHTLQLAGEQAFSLLWGEADKNSTQGNDMHGYCLHAHVADQ